MYVVCCHRPPEIGPKSNLGKLNNVMKKFGRNVKDTAVGAVERIGAGIQGRVRFEMRVVKAMVFPHLCGHFWPCAIATVR